MSAQLELFAQWTRPDECACDHCGWGVWQLVEPHRFFCIAPGGASVNADNRARKAQSCGLWKPREVDDVAIGE